ncbi:MAG: antirestriction protein [Betaproteobacteria bacterium]|nr:antirestriction protein [Betaproteobacteria bacterium]
MAGMLAEDYNGGLWQFYVLANGGFYMAPDVDRGFEVSARTASRGRCRRTRWASRRACIRTAI